MKMIKVILSGLLLLSSAHPAWGICIPSDSDSDTEEATTHTTTAQEGNLRADNFTDFAPPAYNAVVNEDENTDKV